MSPVSTIAVLALGASQATPIRLANLADEAPVHLGVSLKLQDAGGLSQLMAAQRNPSSASHRVWLDPPSFGARFGLSEADYAAVTRWFSSRGFAVTPYPNRLFFEAVGRVDGVRAALGVQVHSAQLGGRRFRTFDGNVALPPDIGSRVLYISGLDTRPRLRHRVHPRILASGYDGGVLGPADLRLEYDMLGLTSDGQAAAGLTTVVLGTQEGTTTQAECSLQSSGSAPFITPSATAIQAYFQLASASVAYNPIVLPNPDDDFDTCGSNQEYQLDVEMQSVGAANAESIDLVLSPASEVFESGTEYVVNRLPSAVAVSTSIGECESEKASETGGPTSSGSEMQAMQQAVDQGLAEGQAWFAASGDTGADDCFDGNSGSGDGFGGGNATVDFPGSMPEMMDIGGTQFGSPGSWGVTGNLLAFVPEVVWNEGQTEGAAGGGGQSLYYPKPSYQAGVGVEAGDGARDVPDLALESALATPGVAVYACGSGQDPFSCPDDGSGSGALDIFGGTSVASPLAAGMFALLAGKNGCSLGDVHAEIYALGSAELDGGPKVFNDITSGNNDFVDPFGDVIQGFSAAPGYDLATGWGSIDLAVLVSQWPSCGSTTTGTSTGVSSTTGGLGSSTGSSGTGGSGTGGTSVASSTGSSSGAGGRSSAGVGRITTIGSSGEPEPSGGGCSCGEPGRPSGELLLLCIQLVLMLRGLRTRQATSARARVGP